MLASLPPGGSQLDPWAGVRRSRWDLQMKDLRIPLPKNLTLPLDANSKRFISTQVPAGGRQLQLTEHTDRRETGSYIGRHKQVLGGAQLIG